MRPHDSCFRGRFIRVFADGARRETRTRRAFAGTKQGEDPLSLREMCIPETFSHRFRLNMALAQVW